MTFSERVIVLYQNMASDLFERPINKEDLARAQYNHPDQDLGLQPSQAIAIIAQAESRELTRRLSETDTEKVGRPSNSKRALIVVDFGTLIDNPGLNSRIGTGSTHQKWYTSDATGTPAERVDSIASTLGKKYEAARTGFGKKKRKKMATYNGARRAVQLLRPKL